MPLDLMMIKKLIREFTMYQKNVESRINEEEMGTCNYEQRQSDS